MHGQGVSKFPHAKTASRIPLLGMISICRARTASSVGVIGLGARKGNKRRGCMGGRVMNLGGW